MAVPYFQRPQEKSREMIRHIVFFSAKDPKNVEAIREGLGALAQIPHSQKFEVRLNRKSDPLSSGIDVVVYAEFADDAAVEAYRTHPVYKATIKLVKPLRELRFSADFEAG
jgi:quinol monooxygenase YgiN